MNRPRLLTGWASLLITTAGLAACTTDPSSPQLPDGLDAARGGGGPSVQAADPNFGHLAEVGLKVLISGSGFDEGSAASWERSGVPDPKIIVHGTRFISSSQVEATISIAGDAELAFYDIAIYTSRGRKGIGTEMFEVTTANAIPGASDAMAVNDAGRVVGRNGAGIYVYDLSTEVMQDIGFKGLPGAIDQLGTTISGQSEPVTKNGVGAPVIWTFGNGWSQQLLPAEGGMAWGIASDATGAAAVIGGHVFVTGMNRHQPAKWTRNGTGGWTLSVLSLPPGVGVGIVMGVNLAGMAAGSHGTSCCYAFAWDAAGNPTLLSPLVPEELAAAHGINSAGTVIVGKSGPAGTGSSQDISSSSRAVAWIRASTADPWPMPIELDTDGCGGSPVQSTMPESSSASAAPNQLPGSLMERVDIPVCCWENWVPRTAAATVSCVLSTMR